MIGRMNNILDNLIAEGKAKPMVVVMPLGHSIQSFWAGPAKASGAGSWRAGRARRAPSAVRSKTCLNDVMPLVESRLQGVEKADDPRDCGSVDGRRPDAEYRVQSSGTVPVRRR